LCIRAASPVDAEAIASIYAPFVAESAISFEEVPPDGAEFARRMATRPRLPWLVAERGGVLAGYAYASVHRLRPAYRWSVDTSIYLGPKHSGQGVGRVLYERLLAEVAALGYVTAFAGIALPNPASVALHTAVGFEPVGVYPAVGYKFGAWHDVGWWSRPLRPAPAAPTEPREWPPSP